MDDSNGITDDPFVKKWHLLAEDRSVRGPYSLSEVASLIEAKRVNEFNYVWTDGLVSWTPLSRTELNSILTGERVLFLQKKGSITDQLQKEEKFRLPQILPPTTYFPSSPHLAPTEKKLFPVTAHSSFKKSTYIYSGSLILCFIIAITGYFYLTTNSALSPYAHQLSKIESRELKNVISMKQNAMAPTIRFAIINQNNLTSLLFAANLPNGTPLEVTISEVPGTLIGSYRFSRSYEARVNEGIGTIGPLTKKDGAYIPMGDYKLRFKHNSGVFEQTVSIGHSNDEVYSSALSAFNAVTILRAEEELIELNDYILSLEAQADELSKTKVTSLDWRNFQTQINTSLQETLTQQDSIYFVDSYLEVNALAGELTELSYSSRSARALKLKGPVRDQINLQKTKVAGLRDTFIKKSSSFKNSKAGF